jgi:SAM-dependent methyltransferase
MLTVDYDRLGVRPGDRLLDLGCGGGRHAFEAYRRGAHVVAYDRDRLELKEATAILGAMDDAGDAPEGTSGAAAVGDALALPFPDAAFDRVIAAEVLEHIPNDTAAMAELARVLRPGGTIGVTVPRWFPEQVCWALDDDYHAPLSPGGHVRVYRLRQLVGRLHDVGLEPRGHHHAHALHTPYWWLKCAIGLRNDDALLPRLYHRFLVWDLTTNALPVRLLERALNPVVGKSAVLYLQKPASNGAPA